MRKQSARLLVPVLVSSAILGGYEVGRAQTTGASLGLVKALSSIGQSIFGAETEFFAFSSTSPLTPAQPLEPDTTLSIEVSEDSAIQLNVNVIRPGDGTPDSPARLVYQVQIGRGDFRLVTNEATVPPPVRDPELDSYRPVISPSPRP